MTPFLFDQGLYLRMAGLHLLWGDTASQADAQKLEAGDGGGDGGLVVAAQGVQACLQLAYPRPVQRRACALKAFDESPLGSGHARQLQVTLRRHAGDSKGMGGVALRRCAVDQQLLAHLQMSCRLFTRTAVARTQRRFTQKLQEHIALIRCKPAGAGALQLTGDLENHLLQVVVPNLEHGLGYACMQLSPITRGCELIGGLHHPVMGEAQAFLARQQEAHVNQGFQRFIRRRYKQQVQQALIAAAACRAGDPQHIALGGRQACQAVDHQVGDVVGVTLPGHGLQAP